MEYNKFIYKINKYKSFQNNINKENKKHYQKKIDYYYNQVSELINNINNQKGGVFTNENLINFLEPTTRELNEYLNKSVNIQFFQNQQEIYEKNHKQILDFIENILLENNMSKEQIKITEQKLKEIEDIMIKMKKEHKDEISTKLQQIRNKINERQKITLDNLFDVNLLRK